MKVSLFFSLWIVAALFGMGYTMVWSFTPGGAAKPNPPSSEKSAVQVQAIIHPLCPCSKATLQLLAEAAQTAENSPSIDVIFCGEPKSSKNVQLAKAIPGATIEFISEQQSKDRFDSATSGQIFVWQKGKLTFSGGITDARGEDAKGAAFTQFKRALQGNSESGVTPVYGCPLQVGG